MNEAIDQDVIASVADLEAAAKSSGVDVRSVAVPNTVTADDSGGAVSEAVPVDAELKDVLQMTFDVGGGAMAAWRGDHWMLSGDESGQLAEAWARWIEYRFGGVNASPDVAVIVSTALVVGPRLLVDIMAAKQAKEGENGEEPAPGTEK